MDKLFQLKKSRNILYLVIVILLTILFFGQGSSVVRAQTASEIQAKIDQRNQDIRNLKKEIDSYQTQIDNLGSQAVSLSSTIKSLDLTRKKLEANIALTQDKIETKNYEIQQLAKQISDKQANVEDDRRIINQTFKMMHESGNLSLPEIFLGSKSASAIVDSLDKLGNLQANLYQAINGLNHDAATLATNKQASEKAKADLVALNNSLSDQKAIVLATTNEQKSLLKETNQNEASYRAILATKKAQQDAFEQEIAGYEQQLNLLVNPSLLPHTGSGVLTWPLDVIKITQYFGNTPFATANPQIYSGKGHPGIDFRASVGTPVKSALNGTVVATGDMDLAGGGRCRAYGRWIMIKHANGLSTLYGHLSLIKVTTGQQVGTGEVIGYSGNTGATTGPHLHFGVYATEGVRITRLVSSSYCSGVMYPLAVPQAYLNPLSYL